LDPVGGLSLLAIIVLTPFWPLPSPFSMVLLVVFLYINIKLLNTLQNRVFMNFFFTSESISVRKFYAKHCLSASILIV